MNRWLTGLIVTVGLMLLAPDAGAHISLMFPAARDTGLKDGPCGTLNSVRGSSVTTFKPGETITVTWLETVDHTGYFRISFDDDGNDGFVEPTAYDDFNPHPSILVNNIADKEGSMQMYSQEVTLPNTECTNCTLQVIQMMTDKPPFGPDGGRDIYYQCADIVLSADGGTGGAGTTSASSGGDGTSGDDSGGCSCSSGGSRGVSFATLALIAFGCLPIVRRART
jgi:hypothetical protein